MDCAENQVKALRHYGISERFVSVHRAGKPIICSSNKGFNKLVVPFRYQGRKAGQVFRVCDTLAPEGRETVIFPQKCDAVLPS